MFRHLMIKLWALPNHTVCVSTDFFRSIFQYWDNQANLAISDENCELEIIKLVKNINTIIYIEGCLIFNLQILLIFQRIKKKPNYICFSWNGFLCHFNKNRSLSRNFSFVVSTLELESFTQHLLQFNPTKWIKIFSF